MRPAYNPPYRMGGDPPMFEIRHYYTGELLATVSAPSAPDALDLYCTSQELALDMGEVHVLPDGSATTPFTNYEILAIAEGEYGEDVNDIDPDLQMPCETCGHDKLDHAFYPAADCLIGSPAPFCNAPYKPNDAALIDHSCNCDGFVLYPVAVPQQH